MHLTKQHVRSLSQGFSSRFSVALNMPNDARELVEINNAIGKMLEIDGLQLRTNLANKGTCKL